MRVGNDPFGQPFEVPVRAQDAVRAALWRGRTGGSITEDDYGWQVARDRAGILLARLPDMGQLMDRLEGP